MDDNGYWRLVEPIWDKIDIDGADVFLKSYSQAPRKAALLYAAHFCQSEICNGGFYQLFHNSTGVLVPEAVDGFRSIGQTEVAEIVETATRILGSPYPRDHDSRRSVLAALDKKTFTALDDKFYALIASENGGFQKAADRYAAAQR
jgi:hypothetical protein